MNEKYINVLKRLYNTNKFKSKKVDLNSIQKACNLFNNPEKKVEYVHVTGTNGKGSVCKKLSSIFENSGMKTGLFISPHISTFRERIQINSKYIEKEYIVDELETIYRVIDKNSIDLTYFELVTLLSFNYFRDSKVDIGVMEVGLGGNLDATNIINPIISIITSIGLDHMDSLGQTQKEIAEKKAGIIKLKRPVVIGSDCNPVEVFVKKSQETNSKLFISKREDYKDIFLDYDKENSNIAVTSMNVLKEFYPEKFSCVNNTNIEYGIKQKQPCRKESVFDNLGRNKVIDHLKHTYNIKLLDNIKNILLDVGHNPHGLEKLMHSLRQDHPKANIRVVCGFSANKDKHDIFKIISSYADNVYFVSADHPRALPYDELCLELESFLLNFNYLDDLFKDLDHEHRRKYRGDVSMVTKKALSDTSESNNNEELVLICGSFYLMGEARQTLGYLEEKDPVELNEMNSVKFNI